MMKTLLVGAFIAAFLMGFRIDVVAVSEHASSNGIYLDADEKAEFVAELENSLASQAQGGSLTIAARDYEEVRQLLLDIPLAETESERALLTTRLAELGVYEFEGEVINAASAMAVDNSDVTLTTPAVFYDSLLKQWSVTCGGHWVTSEWDKLATGDVGGPDAFGVGYTQTSNYHSSVVGFSAAIRDQNSDQYVLAASRGDGDGASGFGFRLQDYIYNGTSGDRVQHYYVGYKWSGSMTYDSDFTSFSGIVTGYYTHTYDDRRIAFRFIDLLPERAVG